MKRKWCGIMKLGLGALGVALIWAGGPLFAQHGPDAIGEHFYPPELLQQTHQMIGLTEDQQATLKEAVGKVQERMAEFQQQLREATEKLAGLVKKEKLDEEAVLAQSDKVLNLEREMKRTQLGLLIKIKNTLTAEQQSKLREVKGKMGGLQAKMRQAQELAQKWEAEGRDLSALRETKDDLEALLKEGNFKEANALLDKTLKLLSEPKK